MYAKNCKACGEDFETASKTSKFCSRKCYDNCRPARTEESKEKIRQITSEHYKTATEEQKRNRWDSIAVSKTKSFTQEEILKIEEVFSRGYVTDTRAVLHHAGIEDKSRKILNNFYTKNPEWLEARNRAMYLPLELQYWDFETFKRFVSDSMIYNHTEMEVKYSLGKKAFKSIAEKLGVRWGRRDGDCYEANLPEKMVAEILTELGVSFQREKHIVDFKFRCDFLLENNKVLEVQGDYWHANPDVFDYGDLTANQKSNVIRDVKKRRVLEQEGFQLLEVWEKDIYEKREEVKNKIKEYAERQY